MRGNYKTTSTYTFANFKAFYKALARFRNHSRIKDLILESVIILGFILAQFVWKYEDMSLMFGVSIALYPMTVYFVRRKSIKREWNKAGGKWGVESHMLFTEEYLEQTKEGETVRFGYYEFKDILETKTHFFLMLGERNGLIVEKRNCSSELCEFLTKLSKEIK